MKQDRPEVVVFMLPRSLVTQMDEMVGREHRDEIYQLKVTLRGIKPPIWRRFQVRSDMTLAGLHEVLQTVMGWLDYHMYRFEIGGKDYGEPDSDFDPVMASINPTRTELRHALPGEGGKFIYEYDFGDGWVHTIAVERFLPPEEGVEYPICLAGMRACPPEDCGGLGGYERLLEVIRDPNHEEYQETIVCLSDSVPSDVKCEGEWAAIQVQGPHRHSVSV